MWGYHSSNRGRGRRTFVLPHVWHGDRDWIGEIYNNWNTLCSILLDVKPYRLFTHKNNCYFWTLEKLISEGGSVRWYRSRLWNGFHCTWVDPDGVEWEYTMPRLRKLPWWYVPMWYEGRIRKFKK